MSFSLESSFGLYPKAMLLHEKRASVLASNIANQDTPNYQAKDIDFKAVLASTKENENAGQIQITNHKHMIPYGDRDLSELKFRVAMQPATDGNTVDAQIEQAEFAENSIRYMASLHFMSSRLKGLQNAIKGQ